MERVLEASESRLLAVASEYNPQEVSNTMWANATMGREPGDRALEGLDARAAVLSTDFVAHHIVLTKWAYAMVGTVEGAGGGLAVKRGRTVCWGVLEEEENLITRPAGSRWV